MKVQFIQEEIIYMNDEDAIIVIVGINLNYHEK